MKKKLVKYIVISGMLFAIAIGVFIIYLISKNIKDLPNYESLRDYEPIITTRLYAADGKLISEYSKEKRVFIPIEMMSQDLKNAFIAAEDSSFYRNSGIDILAIFRTAIKNTISFVFAGSERMGGASTITQQVVKNFLLTKERTIERKIKEAILAIRITKEFEKEKILELYLNQIYLGSGSYGVAAASEVYFDKSLDDLEIEEYALLATLPKAPSKLDPRKNIAKAKIRRDWVISRMYDEGFITLEQEKAAKEKPIVLKLSKNDKDIAQADYFADSVKSELTKLYGSDDVFENGIFVRTTLNSEYQKYANQAIKTGIESYDRRHGYRGALKNVKNFKDKTDEEIVELLNEFDPEKAHDPSWKKAIVTSLEKDRAFIFTEESKIGTISLEDITWATKYIEVDKVGPPIRKADDVFDVGDIIMVERSINEDLISEDKMITSDIEVTEEYSLRQIPEVNGAILVMDPHTGRVLAMMGGYIDLPNQFNRAIQASRQPGSTMKTFGYLTALENGMTPASIIVDEPITLDQGDDLPPYSPSNYSGEFYGPTTLRTGLEKSRNVTTVRMADQIGLDKVAKMVKDLGVNEDPKIIHSLVLGSTETSLMKLIRAYSIMINGGYKIEPSMIEKIQDRSGKTIYKRDDRSCPSCQIDNAIENKDFFPDLINERDRLLDEASSYQITYMLQGVVERGTARKARSVGRIIGGKTGTTNNSYDSWFVGFTPDLIVGVYVGFDQPKNLGKYETGSSIALPIFNDFMKSALKNTPSTPFRVPPSIKFVKIDRLTGKLPKYNTDKRNLFFEAFRETDDVYKILSNDDNDSIFKFRSNKEEVKGEGRLMEDESPMGIY